MRKLKHIYWLGLGSGMIIGAILVQLMTYTTTNPKSIDRSDLEEAAARYGYRLVNEHEVVQLVNEETVHTIYILPDMTLDQIAELLTASRLIDQPEEILRVIERMPEPINIMPGYYEVTGSPSIGDLVEMLITPPS